MQAILPLLYRFVRLASYVNSVHINNHFLNRTNISIEMSGTPRGRKLHGIGIFLQSMFRRCCFWLAGLAEGIVFMPSELLV